MKKTRVTRKDVAKKAGVSTAVVSYVVNNGPRPVSNETRARVQKAIDELGYYPNQIARSLRLQRSSVIGLLIPDVTNLVYAQVSLGVQDVAAPKGYMVMLSNSSWNPARETNFVNQLRANQVDGLITQPSQSPIKLLKILHKAHIPTIMLHHDIAGEHCIAVDDIEGGRLGTQHLLDLSHRRIGFIKGRQTSAVSSEERLIGYRQALEANGVDFDPTLIIENEAMSQETGCQAMEELLKLPSPPTAVFAHNDVMAMGAMYAIRMNGLSIPEDISVIGYDDTINAPFLWPPLTSIRFSKREMGQHAAEILFRLLERKNLPPPETVKLPVELIKRASTGPAPT